MSRLSKYVAIGELYFVILYINPPFFGIANLYVDEKYMCMTYKDFVAGIAYYLRKTTKTCTIDCDEWWVGLVSFPSQVNLQQKLVEVRGNEREAVFEMLAEDKKGQSVTVPVSSILLEGNISIQTRRKWYMVHIYTCMSIAA